MKIVLDTNILLISLPLNSKYASIIDALFDGKIDLIISISIYFEYIEVLKLKAKPKITNAFDDYLKVSRNVLVSNIYYRWQLIDADPDDNKFTDTYLASNADYLVTNDAHFNPVKSISFPKINIVSADEFLRILESSSI